MDRSICAVAFLLLATGACGRHGAGIQNDASLPSSVASDASTIRWERLGGASVPGPYAAGHISYMEFDTSRPGGRPDDATYESTGRPIAVSVFYPAARGDVEHAGPAVYPLDPYYHQLPAASSRDFEAQGFDAAFEAPPVAHGRFPIVLFSSGAVFPDFSHVSLGARLASHGFVVVLPYHFGMQWWPWEPLMDYFVVLAYDRPRDLSFLLDDLVNRNQTPGDLFEKHLLPDHVAAGGWSLGGYAALALAGGDDSVCDTMIGWDPTAPPEWTCGPTVPDPRIQALLLFEAGSDFLHWTELQRVSVPALSFGGTYADQLAWSGDPVWSAFLARQHAALSGHPSFRVDVQRSRHFSYSDTCQFPAVFAAEGVTPPPGWPWDDMGWWVCGPDLIPSARLHDLVNELSVAFLETYLMNEPGSRQVLTRQYLSANAPEVWLFTHERCEPPEPTPDWPPDWVYYLTPPVHGSERDECPN